MRVIRVTNYNIKADIKEPLTACFLSDLHECDYKPVMELIENNAPDFILIGGDYIHNREEYKNGMQFLSVCTTKYPVFCSIGNHEIKYGKEITADTKAKGAVVLDNSDTEFKDLRIGGLSSGYTSEQQGHLSKTPTPDLEFLSRYSEKDGFKILLSHHPEYYMKYIKNTNIQLTLSGHAHGGQWRFFNRGIYAPGQGLFPKYTSGMYDNRLIVGRGLGDSYKVPRINNDHEFIVLHFS